MDEQFAPLRETRVARVSWRYDKCGKIGFLCNPGYGHVASTAIALINGWVSDKPSVRAGTQQHTLPSSAQFYVLDM
jgi:hypothetical protein